MKYDIAAINQVVTLNFAVLTCAYASDVAAQVCRKIQAYRLIALCYS